MKYIIVLIIVIASTALVLALYDRHMPSNSHLSGEETTSVECAVVDTGESGGEAAIQVVDCSEIQAPVQTPKR